MEYRTLDLTVISAKDLKDVGLFSKMDVYVAVSLADDPRTRQRTPVDKDGGKNPSWNQNMKFTIDESLAKQNRLILVFQIRCDRTLGDKDVGEVHVPVKELLDNLGDGKSAQFVSYQVRKPSGKPKGVLNFSYKFGDKVTAPVAPAPAYAMLTSDEPVKAYPPSAGYPPAAGSSAGGYPPAYAMPKSDEPVTAYPPPAGYPPAAGSSAGGYPPAYPPAPAGYGYPQAGGYPPPPQGYGYPGQPGYGYQQQQAQAAQPPKKNNKFGLGLGAGLLGGALGGLLIGDMVSDAGSYDAGFDDAGGFDF